MTPVEELRAAAALMRERAIGLEDAGAWGADGHEVHCPAGIIPASTYDADFAQHIASWHPAVAFAVADWLDREADQQVGDENHSNCDATAKYGCTFTAALAVARAYLGEA